jgi:hypothetical protein
MRRWGAAARHALRREVVGHLRAAALAPVTDDGAARIAAAMIAETFAEEITAAWEKAMTAPAGKGN